VSRGRFSVALAFILVLVNIQCVAVCAVESCNNDGIASTPSPADAPPCHKHHKAPDQQAPAPCSHQIVVQGHAAQAPVTLVFAASVMAMDAPVASPSAFPSLAGLQAAPARAPSPPGPAVLSSVVLRI
jgi:hypothetical protein